MTSTSLRGLFRPCRAWKLAAAGAAAFLFIGSANAQIDAYKLFHQQQQTDRQDNQSQDRSSLGMADVETEDDSLGSLRSVTPASPLRVNRTFPDDTLETRDTSRSEFDKSRSDVPVRREREKPTEFQQFVQNSIGQMLPIYGSWLFDGVPSTYAPVEHIPVNPDYTVGPGDEVDVRVWGQINFNQRLVINRSGDIFIPQVGRISLSGLHFTEVQTAVKSAIGRVYKNFDLSVNMGQLRSIQVLIVGYARRPGTYTLSSLSTPVNAIFASGGPSARGSMRDIQVKRAGKVILTLDLYDLLLHGDKSDTCPLQSGDVIFIPGAAARVAIAGSVETPAVYELKPGASLGDALEYAGGLSPVAAGQHAILQRIDGRAALETQDLELSTAGLSSSLQNGDIVRLLPVVPRFDKTVTLRGNVADPARFPWRAGMKISDLIPRKEALLTRDYWREHNRLTEPVKDPDDKLSQSAEDGADGQPALQLVAAKTSKNFRDESVDTSNDSSLAAAQSGQQDLSVRHFDAKNKIQPPAPEIDWNYAVIERLDTNSLSTHLIPFNLGKVVLDHDASADLPLEPGDIVTVFSDADLVAPRAQQTKYVRIEGEVKMAGVYSVHPGETLRDVVARAGGLTENAYLYGSQFTRESTRREQQKRYAEYLDQLERDINQGASTLSTRIISAQQAATAEASLTSQRAMLQKLRQAPVTGRIVLDLQPNSKTIDMLPALPLENGDRLYIPSVPSTVSVVGTVYNQSAFLYGDDRRLGDYLEDAGGATRYADKSHMFVIRADGSVVSKDMRSHLFSSNFDSLRMYPGDTVVVPTNVNKTTALRGLMDWSQVISNFGIGAAAINVLR